MTAPVVAVKAALAVVLGQLYPDADTSYGEPGTVQTAQVVFIGDAHVSIDRPTMGGAKRSREHSIDLDVVLSAYVFDTDQQAATEAALGLLAQLDDYLRTRGNETLGGACRDAWVSSYDLAENPDDDATGGGRRADVTATITASVRAT